MPGNSSLKVRIALLPSPFFLQMIQSASLLTAILQCLPGHTSLSCHSLHWLPPLLCFLSVDVMTSSFKPLLPALSSPSQQTVSPTCKTK